MATALVVVDVQRDFCEGGAIPVTGGNAVAERIAEDLLVLGKFDYFAFTKDWHIDPGEHWVSKGQEPDFNVSWPVHCSALGVGANLHPAVSSAIDPLAWNEVSLESGEEIVSMFRKGQYGAAYSGAEGVNRFEESLPEWLQCFEVDKVYVVGLAFDYCVKATALDLKSLGFDVTVLSTYTAAVHDAAPVIAELQEAGVHVATEVR